MSLYLVYLRKPAHDDDMRHEPFWEFGSFGRTGCHRKDLLSRHSTLAAGDRLAFLQGGNGKVRVVGLTPPLLEPRQWRPDGALVEVLWNPEYRPLTFQRAPLLINNRGMTSFPAVVPLIRDVARPTWCTKAGSKFRSRSAAVEDPLAAELLAYFNMPDLPATSCYLDAITAPSAPWHVRATTAGWAAPDARRSAYDALLMVAAGLAHVAEDDPGVKSTVGRCHR